MKNLKLTLLTICLACLANMAVMADEVKIETRHKIAIEIIIGSRPPGPNERALMRAEEEAHPNMARAMHNIELSLKDLDAAPEDFGGHKQQAREDLHKAYESIRKALYYRLFEDTH
jgi:hypothetical protein